MTLAGVAGRLYWRITVRKRGQPAGPRTYAIRVVW